MDHDAIREISAGGGPRAEGIPALIDSHAHLDDRKYDEDRLAVLARALEAGVKTIINIGYDLRSSAASVCLTHDHPFIYAAVGFHPSDSKGYTDQAEEQLRTWCQTEPKVVAVGEIGLDFHWDNSPRDVQREVFRRQIRLAKEVNKPIVVHDREAHGEIMDILREESAAEAGGVLHCFSGSLEMAKVCLQMGFYISLAGPVTFTNAPKVREIAAKVPLDRLLIETDSPYLTPHPYRGQRNESAHVRLVAEAVASARGIPLEELAAATTANAKRLFGIV
ncbi:MAG: TatD family hydrolase [Bacillota bacterium]